MDLNQYTTPQLQQIHADLTNKLMYVQPNTVDYVNMYDALNAVGMLLQQRSTQNGYILPQQQQYINPQQQYQSNNNYTPSVGNTGINPYNANYNPSVVNDIQNVSTGNKSYGEKYNKTLQQPTVETNKNIVIQPEPLKYTTIRYTDTNPLTLIKFEFIKDVPDHICLRIPFKENPGVNVASYNKIDRSTSTLVTYKEDLTGDNLIMDFKDTTMNEVSSVIKLVCNDMDNIGKKLDIKLTNFTNKILKYFVNGDLDNTISVDIDDLMSIDKTTDDIDVLIKVKYIKELLLEKVKSIRFETKPKITEKSSLLTCHMSTPVICADVTLNPVQNATTNWLVSEGCNLYDVFEKVSKEFGVNTLVLTDNKKEYDVIKYYNNCYVILGE